ncbi:hypothetical protein EV1_025603 [Malus domestica]
MQIHGQIYVVPRPLVLCINTLQTEYLIEEDPRTLCSSWLIASITRKTFTCLKQDTTGNIYTSKTISL